MKLTDNRLYLRFKDGAWSIELQARRGNDVFETIQTLAPKPGAGKLRRWDAIREARKLLDNKQHGATYLAVE